MFLNIGRVATALLMPRAALYALAVCLATLLTGCGSGTSVYNHVSYIAFVERVTGADSDQLFRISEVNGKPIQITNEFSFFKFSPVWSPDGKKIAYITSHTIGTLPNGQPGPIPVVVIVSANGGQETQISANITPSLVKSIDWSPDGAQLLVCGLSGDRMKEVNVTTGDVKDVAITGLKSFANPAYSSDGQEIVFVASDENGASGIYRASRGDLGVGWSSPTRIVEGGQFPSWSPDGKRIAYCVSDGKGDLQVATRLATGDPNSTRLITTTPGYSSIGVFKRNASALLISSGPTTENVSEKYLLFWVDITEDGSRGATHPVYVSANRLGIASWSP